MANSGIPIGEWSGSNATRELHETIKAFNAAAEEQTQQMIILTRRIMWLTGVMLILVGVQIVLTIKQLAG